MFYYLITTKILIIISNKTDDQNWVWKLRLQLKWDGGSISERSPYHTATSTSE